MTLHSNECRYAECCYAKSSNGKLNYKLLRKKQIYKIVPISYFFATVMETNKTFIEPGKIINFKNWYCLQEQIFFSKIRTLFIYKSSFGKSFHPFLIQNFFFLFLHLRQIS